MSNLTAHYCPDVKRPNAIRVKVSGEDGSAVILSMPSTRDRWHTDAVIDATGSRLNVPACFIPRSEIIHAADRCVIENLSMFHYIVEGPSA